jgi:hypothetical protein
MRNLSIGVSDGNEHPVWRSAAAALAEALSGPASAMNFGPLFRFVAGAEYSAPVVSAHLAARASSAA